MKKLTLLILSFSMTIVHANLDRENAANICNIVEQTQNQTVQNLFNSESLNELQSTLRDAIPAEEYQAVINSTGGDTQREFRFNTMLDNAFQSTGLTVNGRTFQRVLVPRSSEGEVTEFGSDLSSSARQGFILYRTNDDQLPVLEVNTINLRGLQVSSILSDEQMDGLKQSNPIIRDEINEGMIDSPFTSIKLERNPSFEPGNNQSEYYVIMETDIPTSRKVPLSMFLETRMAQNCNTEERLDTPVPEVIAHTPFQAERNDKFYYSPMYRQPPYFYNRWLMNPYQFNQFEGSVLKE